MSKQPEPSDAPDSTQGVRALRPATPSGLRTPLYEATNSPRYERQYMIRGIQELTGNRLICYVGGIEAEIDRDDALAFADLIHNVAAGLPLDLLLHTPGGDINAAEKLVYMIRKRMEDAPLRVIVPDFAKSAGTLMALGADVIVMSDSSELGPIDPQILRRDHSGTPAFHSVLNYLQAYEELRDAIDKDPEKVSAQLMFGKLDHDVYTLYLSLKDRARACAENFLRRWMFRNTSGNVTEIVKELLNLKRWLSHGQPISHEDAKGIGLVVEYLSPSTEVWASFWRLYCRQRIAITQRQKLFESDHVHLVLDAERGVQEGA